MEPMACRQAQQLRPAARDDQEAAEVRDGAAGHVVWGGRAAEVRFGRQTSQVHPIGRTQDELSYLFGNGVFASHRANGKESNLPGGRARDFEDQKLLPREEVMLRR